MAFTRRDAMFALAGATAAGAFSHGLAPSAHAGDHATLVRQLHASMTPAQRRAIFLPWEHPSRQLVNTVAILKNPHLGTLLDAHQRALVWAMWHGMQSEAGRARFREPLRAEAGGLDGCVLAIYGDPQSGPCQSVISGGHLQMRGGDIPNGAFGDGFSYGHQVGNGIVRVPGNVWAFHSDAANALFSALSSGQRRAALALAAPYELTVQLQGADGIFEGLAGAALNADQRAMLVSFLEDILSAYPEERAREALSDIEANGGVDRLHLRYFAEQAYYTDGATLAQAGWRADALPYFQVWRIDGPGTVIHFKGAPHVHAYVHIARDPGRQNVGDVLTRTDQLLEGESLRGFMETAMANAAGADIGLFPGDVAARFPAGEVSEGLVWSLDPFANRLHVVQMHGSAMTDMVRAKGRAVDPTRTYRLVAPDYYLDVFGDEIGEWSSREDTGLVLRDVLVDALRREPTSLTG
jgi:hypothetical protein